MGAIWRLSWSDRGGSRGTATAAIQTILKQNFVPFLGGGWCYSYGPQQGPDRQQKKEERGLKQRRKQKEAAQGDPEPKKGNLWQIQTHTNVLYSPNIRESTYR